MLVAQSFPDYAARLIRQQRAAVRRLVNVAFEAAEIAKNPIAGRNAVESWMRARSDAEFVGTVLDQGVDNVIRLLAAIDDEARGVEILMGSERAPMLSPVALQRGLIEATLVTCYLLDVTDPLKHFLRNLAYQLEAVEGSQSMAEKFGLDLPMKKRQQLIEAVDAIHEFLAENGVELVAGNGNVRFTHHVSFDGVNETIAFNATDAMNKYAKEHSYEWSLTSGALHARGWYLPSVIGGISESALASSTENYAAVSSGVINAYQSLITAIGLYTGVDVSEYERSTHLRLRVLLAAANGDAVSELDVTDFKKRSVADEWRVGEPNLGRSFVKSPERWRKQAHRTGE